MPSLSMNIDGVSSIGDRAQEISDMQSVIVDMYQSLRGTYRSVRSSGVRLEVAGSTVSTSLTQLLADR